MKKKLAILVMALSLTFSVGIRAETASKEVNEWIRNTKKEDGGFDNYFDFDKNLKDNNNQTNLAEIYDSGDGLHPSAKGYEQIVNTIDNLDLFIINN